MKKNLDLYQIYSQKYDRNVDKIAKYSPSEAVIIAQNKMTREEFNGSFGDYRARLVELQPTTRPSREDVANWIANRETKTRSYKQAIKIKGVAKQFGYDLKLEDIQFNSDNSKAVQEFWEDYKSAINKKIVDTSAVWGSP